MDPISVVGLAGSVIGLVDVAARSISVLRALQQRWKAADLTINLLISQLTILRAALNQLEEWITASPNANQHYQLIIDLGATLESCEILLLFIDGKLNELDWSENNILSFESKIKIALQDTAVKDCATHLANQSTAINLLLTVVNCRSLSAQDSLLQAQENREVLRLAKGNSPSLFGLRDSASFRSSFTSATERSSLLDVSFDFDAELTATKVYHRQWASLIRGALGRGNKAKRGPRDLSKVSNLKILATGSKLPDVVRVFCEECCDPQLRREQIYQIVLDTTNATLNRMVELHLPMETAHIKAFLQQKKNQSTSYDEKEEGKETTEELRQSLVSLWNDDEVKRCYQDNVEITAHPSATYFLDSITRIAIPGYVPSSEDAARSLIIRTKAFDSATLPLPMSSQTYTFVKWTPHKASLWVPPADPPRDLGYECEQLDAISFMVDLAICNTDLVDNSTGDGWEETLQRFARICKQPWLVGKDVLLLFKNLEKLQPRAHAPSFKDEPTRAGTVDAIVDKFRSLNEDDSREIYILFDNKVGAGNLEGLHQVMKPIMRKKELSARRL